MKRRIWRSWSEIPKIKKQLLWKRESKTPWAGKEKSKWKILFLLQQKWASTSDCKNKCTRCSCPNHFDKDYWFRQKTEGQFFLKAVRLQISYLILFVILKREVIYGTLTVVALTTWHEAKISLLILLRTWSRKSPLEMENVIRLKAKE